MVAFSTHSLEIKAHSYFPLFVTLGTLADLFALPVMFVPFFTLADIQRCIIGWLHKIVLKNQAKKLKQ